ncbi:hypothetical protein [Psychrobacter jeotgali]|uniref:hypothetical protein n=1 Tax=Psychrobacter jeotgali TaxID=179010 RepID=UPI001919E42D|nr:hypothetical protein [Psychrobacter jeotgali]
MNHRTVGIITAILGLGGLIALLNASTSTPVIYWPIEAYLGAAFTIGWLTRLPAWFVYILAALVFIVMIVVCYMLGSGIYRLLTRPR